MGQSRNREELGRFRILGAAVDNVSMAEAEARVASFIAKGDRLYHVLTLNAEILYHAQKDAQLMSIIKQADLVTPDGVGIVWGAGQLGTECKERVAGIDLMTALCRQAATEGWRVYLLGAAPGVAEEAAKNLCLANAGLHIVGTHHGYSPREDWPGVMAELAATEPQLVFVAMGSPAQDEWIRMARGLLGPCVAVGVGGSFDVLAGNVKRAPRWMQKLGCEWLWRLLSNPKRIGRMMALPKFMCLVRKEARRMKK